MRSMSPSGLPRAVSAAASKRQERASSLGRAVAAFDLGGGHGEGAPAPALPAPAPEPEQAARIGGLGNVLRLG
jgi:hypothetical protein